MKKILTATVLLTFLAATGFSQDNSFRFGLKTETSINWYKPDNAKKLTNGGMVAKFGYGLITEFALGGLASLSTGIEVTTSGGKLDFTSADTASYQIDNDDAFIKGDTTLTGKKYTLNSRTYKNSYVSIPLMLKMKTKEVGAMTYFGQFGILASVRLKSKVDDMVTNTLDEDIPITDLENTKDMGLLNIGLKVGAGVEWNLSGSTSLLIGVDFNPGFLNVLQKNSEYLVRPDNEAVEQVATQNRVALTVGFLF